MSRFNRKGPKGPLPNLNDLQQLVKGLDTPEMKKLYRRQKSSNPGLDKDVEELYEQLKDVFNHDRNSSK